jgi:hypothetical protein
MTRAAQDYRLRDMPPQFPKLCSIARRPLVSLLQAPETAKPGAIAAEILAPGPLPRCNNSQQIR